MIIRKCSWTDCSKDAIWHVGYTHKDRDNHGHIVQLFACQEHTDYAEATADDKEQLMFKLYMGPPMGEPKSKRKFTVREVTETVDSIDEARQRLQDGNLETEDTVYLGFDPEIGTASYIVLVRIEDYIEEWAVDFPRVPKNLYDYYEILYGTKEDDPESFWKVLGVLVRVGV